MRNRENRCQQYRENRSAHVIGAIFHRHCHAFVVVCVMCQMLISLQCHHCQYAVTVNHRSVSSGDCSSQQCETSFGSHHTNIDHNTDMFLINVIIYLYNFLCLHPGPALANRQLCSNFLPTFPRFYPLLLFSSSPLPCLPLPAAKQPDKTS